MLAWNLFSIYLHLDTDGISKLLQDLQEKIESDLPQKIRNQIYQYHAGLYKYSIKNGTNKKFLF